MALLTAQTVGLSALALTSTAVSALGDTFANTGEEVIIIETAGTATVVTITSPTLCNQGFSHDLTVSLGATVKQVLGKFSVNRFNDASGLCKITCSPVTNVTISVVKTN